MSQAVIYRRQSLDKLNDELGIERQLKECKRVAKARGSKVSEVITDNDTSASKRGRPGYGRLLQLMATGNVSEVIILRIDRLLRLNDELEELIQLVETHPVKVITVEGDIDLSTPQGRLIARILVSVARAEMEVKSSRHKLSNQQRAESGLPHAGRRAFGYEVDGITQRKHEADALGDIGFKFLSGWSYNELAYYLNDKGIRTAMGGPFYSVAVRQMLMRKRYAGIREYEGTDYPAQWPAIFDRPTWDRIQYTVRLRSEKVGDRPQPRKYLLTGLLECGACGHTMTGQPAKDRKTGELRTIYRCKSQGRITKDDGGCGRVSRGTIPLEHWIKELVCYRLDSHKLSSMLQDAEESELIAKLSNEREAASIKLTELLDLFTDGTLTKPEYLRAKQRAQSTMEGLDSELLALHRDSTMNGLLRAGERVSDRWESEANGWRRQLLDLLVAKIVVNPGRSLPRYRVEGKVYYFDPTLIEPHWLV